MSTRSHGGFYGYKLDMAVCTATDLPLAWNVRTARAATVAGYAIADNVSGNLNAAVDGFAAGALLVMLIDSMIPEAVRKGGDEAGLVTVLGFAVAAALSGLS